MNRVLRVEQGTQRRKLHLKYRGRRTTEGKATGRKKRGSKGTIKIWPYLTGYVIKDSARRSTTWSPFISLVHGIVFRRRRRMHCQIFFHVLPTSLLVEMIGDAHQHLRVLCRMYKAVLFIRSRVIFVSGRLHNMQHGIRHLSLAHLATFPGTSGVGARAEPPSVTPAPDDKSRPAWLSHAHVTWAAEVELGSGSS